MTGRDARHTEVGEPMLASDDIPTDFDASLFEGLADVDLPQDGELEDLLASTRAEVGAERGFRAWMRALPTRARVALVAVFGLTLVLLMTAASPRPDLGQLEAGALAVRAFVFSLAFAGSLAVGLRPLHRPLAPRWVELSLVAASPLALAILAWWPLGALGTDPDDMRAAASCFGSGLVFGLPVYVIMRLLDRGGRRAPALLAGIAAAVTSNAMLSLHCGNDAFLHVLCGHGALGLVFVLLAAIGVWLFGRGARARRPA